MDNLTKGYPSIDASEDVIVYAASINVSPSVNVKRVSITGNVTFVPAGAWFVRDTAVLEVSGTAGTVTISPTGRTLVGAQLAASGLITTYDGLTVERIVIECVGTNKFRITNYA